MPNKEALKDKIKQAVKKLKHRKKTEGQVNIEGISKPKKHKPKKVKEQQGKQHSPASVGIGAHGGRYIQEASGHKRYLKEGTLAGKKKFKKAVLDVLEDILEKSEGEGSRGGKIVGHDKRGKAVYESEHEINGEKHHVKSVRTGKGKFKVHVHKHGETGHIVHYTHKENGFSGKHDTRYGSDSKEVHAVKELANKIVHEHHDQYTKKSEFIKAFIKRSK